MSQWTHVSGCFRVDGIPAMGIVANLTAILGTPSSRDYDAEPYERGKNIPNGSEGTIQYEATIIGDGLAYQTVAVWGDLRDFGSEDTAEIDAWFTRIVQASAKENLKQSRLMLRAAHLLVEVEYRERYLLVMDDGATVRRVELSAATPQQEKGQ